MARSYAPLLTSIWADKDFRGQTAEEQRLYLLVMSQANISYAGVIPLTAGRWAGMAGDTSTADILAAITGLEAARFFVIDHETEELFVRSFVKHNGVLKQPQLRTAMRKAFGDVLSGTIRAAFLAELPEAERKAVVEAFPTLSAPCSQASRSLPEACSPTGDTGIPISRREGTLDPDPEPVPGPAPSSSSRVVTTDADPVVHRDDDEGDRIGPALRLIASRRLERRVEEVGRVGDPGAWLVVATRRARDEFEGRLRAFLALSPDLTAEELADEVEPDLRPPAERRPLCGECENGLIEVEGGAYARCPCQREETHA